MDSLRSLDLHSSAFCKIANSLHTFYIFLKKSISKVKQILNYNCISERYFEASFKTNRISTVSLSVNVLLLLFSRPVMSDSLQPHELQHARPPCPSLFPGVCPSSCPLSRWWHPTTSSSVAPFSPCLQSFPKSVSFPMSQLFTSGGQSIGASASASVLPMNIQCWFPLGLTGLIS